MDYRLSNIIPLDFIPDFLKAEYNNLYVNHQDFSLVDFTGGATFTIGLTYRNSNSQFLGLNLFTNDQLRIEITQLADLKINFSDGIYFNLGIGTIRILLPAIFKPVDANRNVIPNQR